MSANRSSGIWPRMRDSAVIKRQLQALFDTDLAALYRLVRRNLRKGREPLALHRGKADGEHRYYLSAVTGERVQRPTFLGVVDHKTTEDDLRAMTEEE